MDRTLPTVAGLGNVGLDWIKHPAGGHFTRVGGTCANVLCVMGEFGWQVAPIGRLDDSAVSRRIEALLEEQGVKCDWLKQAAAMPPPGVLCSARLRRGGGVSSHFFRVCPLCGAQYPPVPKWGAETEGALEAALNEIMPDVLVMDRSHMAFFNAIDWLRGNDDVLVAMLPQSFDGEGNSRWIDMLDRASVVSVSTEQVPASAIENAPRPRTGTRLEICTRGGKGLLWRRRGQQSQHVSWTRHEAFVVKGLLDVTGAGDWFAGSLLAQMTGGKEFVETASDDAVARAIDTAMKAASYACMFGGARTSAELGPMPRGDHGAMIRFFAGMSQERTFDIDNPSSWPDTEPSFGCPQCP